MNSTHAAVGVGSISAMDALTTLLTGFHGLDGEHAAALAWLIAAGLGALYSIGQTLYAGRRNPAAKS